jgi:hypothetical protein
MKRTIRVTLLAASLTLFFLLCFHPLIGITQDDDDLILGRIYNDTDIAPPFSGPVTLNIVVDRVFMGRVEPGESVVIGLPYRRVPYNVRAYVFHYDGSAFFAEVDLPLNHDVAVPISHRGELTPFWVAFEGI